MNQHQDNAWREASRREACPVCGKPDWCSLTGPRGDAEAVVCMRVGSDNQRPNGGWLHQMRGREPSEVGPRGGRRGGVETKPPQTPRSTRLSFHSTLDGAPNATPEATPQATPRVYATAREAVEAYRSRLGAEDRRWVYHDAAGEPVFVVLRWDAQRGRRKEVRPACRCAEGWRLEQPPAGRPLYRLTDVLASDGVVYVTEGEPAADAAVAAGLEATTASGGSNAAAKTDWSPLAGRDVVLLPDNDPAGAKHAEQVVEQLARLAEPPTVRVVALPGLPPKGDAVDWFAAGGTVEALLRAVGSTEPIELPTPERPLVYRPFPTDRLPDTMARFVREAARSVGCDESMVALPALTAAAGAIGATRTVRLKRTWHEPAVLWCVVVSPSGAMKSQGRKLVLAPILRRQKQTLAAYQDAVRAFGPSETVYERDLAAWKRSKSDTPPPERPEPPVLCELILSDTTVEAVAKALRANPRGLLLDRDELAAWFGSFDAYKSGKGGDAQNWMNTHGAGYVKVNRSTADGAPLFVDRACVSVCGTIQPSIFTKTLSSDHRESGFAARLLIANPPRRPKRWTDDEVSDATEAAFESAMLALLDLGFDADEQGESVPVALGLTPPARRRFVAFVNRHGEAGVQRQGDEAAAWSKLEGYAARLALVMTLFDDPHATHVGDDTLAAAIELIEWFGDEAARFYRGARETEQERQRRELAEWVGLHGGTATPAEVARSGPRAYRGKAAQVETVMAELVAHGVGVWRDKSDRRRGGRPTRVFELAQRLEQAQSLGQAQRLGLAQSGVETKPPRTPRLEGFRIHATPQEAEQTTEPATEPATGDAAHDGWEAA